jgi:putative solute:sodium symporter small subunit
MNATSTSSSSEPIKLGLLLTAIQIAVYAGFILTSCFNVPLLRTQGPAGFPLSFVFGFGVIACGVVLTAIYVFAANQKEESPA